MTGTVDGIELSSSVKDPYPGETLTLTAQSFDIDINAASLTWTSGGQTLARGIGATSVTVQAPALGRHLTVDVTASSPNGQTINNSITIGSASVDLVLEPDGYVPPLYMGKIPAAYQNSVTFTAVPHLANSAGVEYDPKTLIYDWSENDSAMQDGSGYGKQSIVIPGSIVPRPYTVSVTVSTRDGSAEGMAQSSVAPGAPSISFYDNDPLYGPLYNEALGDTVYVGSQRELGVLAVPFGFDLPVGGLSWAWLINGDDHPELDGNQAITLRAPQGSSGSSDVELDTSNSQSVLQQGSGTFSVIFNSNQPLTRNRA